MLGAIIEKNINPDYMEIMEFYAWCATEPKVLNVKHHQ
jgi:hypothetical protein